MRLFGKKTIFTRNLLISPPQPLDDRHGVVIAARAKNEASYIGDWLLFHRAVGVRHFYIYDDGSTDRTCDVIRETLSPEEFTIFPWSSRMIDEGSNQFLDTQVIAFAHAILNFGATCKWMAFIDVDEFLLPKSGKTIEEALEGANGFPAVSLPWHMFGTSGHKIKPEGSALLNFTMRSVIPSADKKNGMAFKCIVDPCEVVQVGVHHFCTRTFGEVNSNDAGQRATREGRKEKAFYSSQYLQLNHYYTRSEHELMEKISRGNGRSSERYKQSVLRTLKRVEADTVEDRGMIDFLKKHGIDLSKAGAATVG